MSFLYQKKPTYQQSFTSYDVKVYYQQRSDKDCYMSVKTKSGESHIFPISHPLYRQAIYSFSVGDEKAVDNAVYLALSLSNLAFATDKTVRAAYEFVQTVTKQFNQQAKEAADAVTPEQNIADEQLLTDAIKYAKASRKERKKAQAQMREDFKEVMSEFNDDGSDIKE
jgi:hypothetical protein